MNRDMVELLLEMKEDLVSISSDINRLNDKLDAHADKSKNTALKVEQLERDANRAKGVAAALLSIGAVTAALKGLFQ